jgi:nicotinate-nucleotide--dimethylbenzimidazole phosphoribosyltransferase
MSRLAEICAGITPPDAEVAARTQRRLDFKTKPRRSLGRLEDLACQYAAIRRDEQPALPEKAIIVMGADHGVAARGVSAYPQEVTAQMLENFAAGGAAINVLARHAGARVVVVDIGVLRPVVNARIESARVAAGTADLSVGPAMSSAQAEAAIDVGLAHVERLHAQGVSVVGLGEMGIGNTTSASALTALLTGCSPEEVTGFGTGIDDAARARKVQLIQRALALHALDPQQPLAALASLGGLEIAGLVGVVLGAASRRMAVVLDGFIASTAALIAVRMAPAAQGYLVPSHRSVEAGHRALLRELQAVPLFEFDMRLGEGSGAALAMTLLDAAVKILLEMATFESAGVTDAGA